MTFSSNVGYTRWYDRMPELSQAVRLMEKLPLARQQWISGAIISLMPFHQVSQHTDGHKKIGSEKVIGLMKSKGKRRWYDQDPLVHQAFNHLYVMNEQTRYEMALKILICMKALERLNISDSNPITGFRFSRTIFNKPLPYLMQKTKFEILPERKHGRVGFALELRRSAPSEYYPDSPDTSSRTNQQSAISAGHQLSDSISGSTDSGMKIVRLKRSNA